MFGGIEQCRAEGIDRFVFEGEGGGCWVDRGEVGTAGMGESVLPTTSVGKGTYSAFLFFPSSVK